MDPSLQQHSLSHFACFPQETSINSSQVPNLLSHPAPRRVLPLQNPEECNMNKLSPNWHPSGMKYPAALISSSSTNIVSPVNSLLKDRLGPLKPFPPSHGDVLSSPVNGATSARENLGPQHNMIRLDSGYFTSPQVVSATQIKTHMSAERTFIPTIFNSPSPQFGKSISNPLPSYLSRRDQGIESKIPFSNSGKKKDVSQREDPHKSHQHEQTCSRESLIPVMDPNSTSQKRRREWEPCLKNIKKPCHKGINHGTTETNGLTPGTSPRSSLDHQPSPQSSSVFESSHETTKRLLKSEPACSALSSTPKSSRLVLVCPKKTASTGAKKGFITTENNIVKLRLTSTLSEGSPKNQNEENQKKSKSSPSKVHHKECSKPPHVGSVCSNSNSGCSVPVKTESKKLEGISPKPASKPSLSSSSCSTPERSKTSRIRKPTLVLDDIDQLFTPDPNVYVVRPACKAPKCRMEEQTIKSPTSKKGSNYSPTVTPISSPATQPLHATSSPASNMTVFLPTVTLERLKLEESQRCPKDGGNRHSSVKESQLSTKDGGIRHCPVKESQLSPKDAGIRHGPVKESQLSPKDAGIRHGPVKESQLSPKDAGIRHCPVKESQLSPKDAGIRHGPVKESQLSPKDAGIRHCPVKESQLSPKDGGIRQGPVKESQLSPEDGGIRHCPVKESQLSPKDGGIRHCPVKESQLSPKVGGIRQGPVKESQLSPKDGGIKQGLVKESQLSPKDAGIRQGPVKESQLSPKDAGIRHCPVKESQLSPKDGGIRHGPVKESQVSPKDGGIRHGPVKESQVSPKDGGIRHGPVKESQLSPKDGGIRHGPVKESQVSPKDGGIRHGPVNSSRSQSKDESLKPQHNPSLKPKTSEGLHCSETDTAASVQETSPPCTKPPPVEEAGNDGSKGGKEEDSIDVELDLGLSISYDIDPSQSSDSSEEEPLISLQEMMECVAKPPDTPQKEAVSEPSTPGCRSSQSKTSLLSSSTKPGVYKNNLDQMLKEINSTKKAKEMEAQLLSACNEDLLRLAEYEAAEENQEEVANEHQEFLQHFSLMSGAIKEIPPGEMVFNLERFGQIFHQDSLQLRQCHVSPQGASQKTLIWSSPAQLRLHLIVGLFEEAYCNSPCPAQVTRFLFKMMSVHSERIISNKILQALCDIACSAAYQIVNSDNQKFEVWVPSLADVTLVFMNMGAAFVTLFPFESLQPSFTEGDLLEDVYFQNESPSNNNEEISFPEHNCTNILKYLSYCMGLCPRAYSNDELLLLLTVVGRISLDTRQILQSNVSVSCLLYTIISNIRDWSSMLPRVCKALTDLTDDHHNMCLLVQLLPDNKRGIELRRHLSMCFISKLLDGHCTYVPVETELSLAELRPYLPQMQPSALLRSIQQKDKEEEMATHDQQAYYLCYSLLTLTNEASNLQVFKPQQKGQLLVLSSELETHVKCDIRESEKCLYRSKVKDLVARIYTKWQMLLQKTRPLNGKLYDYWQPVETFGTEDDEEAAVFVEDNVETIIINENDTLIADVKEEENKNTEVKEDMEVDEHPGDEEDDTKAREAAEEQVTGDASNACDAASRSG